ncbi:lytic transglycosylase domain-containing protein [Acidocella facilis]|uniref:lytic transglycosylase domain-containing protein n=1 Tax=Acidocella facilis TaxID=525 RepID=UPI001F289FEE|nr:lytic transglycosylase domain-containing protein [Acidocella facilis]
MSNRIEQITQPAAPSRKFITKIFIPLFAEKPSHSFVPLACQTAAARSEGQGRPSGRRLGALPLTEASTMAGWQGCGRMVLLAAVSLALLSASGVTAHAQSPPSSVPASTPLATDMFGGFVSEAAHRFSIPAAWIRAVMHVESDDDPAALSPEGAMGLMQIMPGTYEDMRQRYGLGADPYQPHDNILAGTAYLREMLDCYGTAGFLAAYNAGPDRYAAHLATGQPLPPETILYVARITPLLAGAQAGSTMIAAALSGWSHAPLFVGQVSSGLAAQSLTPGLQSERDSAAPSLATLAALIPQSNGMFASHFDPMSP